MSQSDDDRQLGKISLRIEGDWLVAYVDGIRLAAVPAHAKSRAFLGLMQSYVDRGGLIDPTG